MIKVPVNLEVLRGVTTETEKDLVSALLQSAGFHRTQAWAIRIMFYDPLKTDEERVDWINRIDSQGDDTGTGPNTPDGKLMLLGAPGWKCRPDRHSHECAQPTCDGCPLASYERDVS